MTDEKKDSQAPNLGQPFGPLQKKTAPPSTTARAAPATKPSGSKDDDTLEIASPGAVFGGGDSASRPPGGSATTRSVGSPLRSQGPKQQAAPVDPAGPAHSPQAQPPTLSKAANVVNPGLTPGHGPKPAAKKISPQQAQVISNNLKTGGTGLSEEQSKKLIKSLESEDLPPRGSEKAISGVSSIASRAAAHDGPPAAGPLHGIALFNGPVITLTTPEPLTTGDEIIIRNHRYQLKAGKAASKGSTFLLAAALTVAAFLAGQYVAGDQAGAGPSIVGVALDQNGVPASSGAVVRLPELGQTTYTDEKGFFRFDNVPTGTYRIEYTLSGSSRGGAADISVSEGVTSLLTLADSGKKVVSSRKKSNRSRSSRSSSESQKETSASALVTGIGSLAVTSQTSGAKVYLDGQSLGSVNNTFRRIRAGERTIKIKKSGYETSTVLVHVAPGKIARVDINLEPIVQKQTRKVSQPTRSSSSSTSSRSLSANEYYQRGRDLFKAGDLRQAREHFDQALAKKPSMADAYYMKGEIAGAQGDEGSAFDHYLQAGEIWSAQRRYGDALAALDNAVEQNPDNPLGYKVRGDIYQARGHSTIAQDDYKRAIKIDDKYYGARLALGIALFEKGAYRQAQKELRRAKDINDEEPVLYHYLMLTALAKRDQRDVNNYFREFREIASEADMKRFYGDAKLAEVREVVRD